MTTTPQHLQNPADLLPTIPEHKSLFRANPVTPFNSEATQQLGDQWRDLRQSLEDLEADYQFAPIAIQQARRADETAAVQAIRTGEPTPERTETAAWDKAEQDRRHYLARLEDVQDIERRLSAAVKAERDQTAAAAAAAARATHDAAHDLAARQAAEWSQIIATGADIARTVRLIADMDTKGRARPKMGSAGHPAVSVSAPHVQPVRLSDDFTALIDLADGLVTGPAETGVRYLKSTENGAVIAVGLQQFDGLLASGGFTVVTEDGNPAPTTQPDTDQPTSWPRPTV